MNKSLSLLYLNMHSQVIQLVGFLSSNKKMTPRYHVILRKLRPLPVIELQGLLVMDRLVRLFQG